MEHKLSSDEIQKVKDGHAVLLDVRSEGELAEKNCRFAQHWDVDQMSRGIFPNFRKDQPVFIFCRSGNRSAVAQALLTKEGYDDVHNLGGIVNVPEELCA